MLLNYIAALKRYRLQLGWQEFTKFVFRKAAMKTFTFVRGYRADVEKQYEFMNPRPFHSAISVEPGMHTINWVVPDFSIGSGGHINIFRLVRFCEQAGFVCRIVIVGHTERASADKAREMICQHFSVLEADVYLGEQDMPPAMITVATSWQTAYVVRNFQSTRFKAYFVQDYEPYFYPLGSDFYFAQHTYDMNFFGITAGGWLAQKLANEHRMETISMGFSYDRELYRQFPRTGDEIRRVFFYARPVTSRRGFELGLLALSLVAESMPDVEFVLAGWDTSTYDIKFRHHAAGNVPLSELGGLYSLCDAALVISSTNLSLLPLELMACGCVVVSNRGANTEWLLNDENAVLVDPTPAGLAEGILNVLRDDDLRKLLAARGRAFANRTDWKTEAQKVIAAFKNLQKRH